MGFGVDGFGKRRPLIGPLFCCAGCGVFNDWRSDLMGQCRPDYAANVQERDVAVMTPYGRIRGFFVQLFDGPGVNIGDRPGVYHTGKIWRTVSTFLGVPYATPPVDQGRFKVRHGLPHLEGA